MKHVIVISKLVTSVLIVLIFLPIKANASSPFDFEQHIISDHIPNSRTVEVTDIDGDGDKDILGSDRQNNKLYLYVNDGHKNFAELVIDDIDAYWIDAADIDQDGDMDLAVVGFAIYGYEGHWYENQGNITFVRHHIAHWGLDPSYLKIIDFDGDGNLDFVANANGWNHAHIYWYENDGSQNFAQHEILDLFSPQNSGCQTSIPADIDGDGDFDLVQACDSSPVFWLINDGNQNFTRRDISRIFSFSPYNIQAVDIDHDSDIDVLVPDMNDGTFWLENIGSQQFIEHRISSNRLYITTVRAVDIEHDGDMDVVEADNGLNQVSLWMNQGNMTFTEQVIASNLGGVLSVFLSDLDRDGDKDIIVDEFYVGKLSWFEQNQEPTANAGPDLVAFESDSVTLDASASFDPDGNIVLYQWDLDNDGEYDDSNEITAELRFPDNGSYTVGLRVIDNDGLSTIDQATVNVFNVVPTGAFAAAGPISEGGSSSLSLTNVFDPSAVDTVMGFRYSFACDGQDSSLASSYSAAGIASTAICAFGDNGTYLIKGRIFDKDDGFATYHTTVIVHNVIPMLGVISAPVVPVQVNTISNTSANFTDPGVLDTHTAIWNWDDNSTSAGTVTETSGSGSVTGSHSYTSPGVYTVKVTVTDDDGDSSESIFQYIVIYDPNGGFVTGGGWINSPVGAYKSNLNLTGKATFGFVSKYQKGASIPTGNTEFQFHVANMNFRSTSYDWLVIAGTKAQYKGVGTINSAGEYGFMLTAIDGTPDKFRIKIWEKATNATVYDNMLGAADDANPSTALEGGSIVIHKAK